MQLIINGKNQEFENVETLNQLISHLNVSAELGGIAVAVNAEVVPKSEWTTTRLKSGDEIEVIHAVQGG